MFCTDCDTEVTLEGDEENCPECGAYLFDLDPFESEALLPELDFEDDN